MRTTHRLRVSDADRQQVIAALERHTADGRLSLDEYSDRVGHVFRARTYGELAATMADLPEEPAVDHHAVSARHLAIAFLMALLALVVIGTAIALFR